MTNPDTKWANQSRCSVMVSDLLRTVVGTLWSVSICGHLAGQSWSRGFGRGLAGEHSCFGMSFAGSLRWFGRKPGGNSCSVHRKTWKLDKDIVQQSNAQKIRDSQLHNYHNGMSKLQPCSNNLVNNWNITLSRSNDRIHSIMWVIGLQNTFHIRRVISLQNMVSYLGILRGSYPPELLAPIITDGGGPIPSKLCANPKPGTGPARSGSAPAFSSCKVLSPSQMQYLPKHL